MSENTLGQQWIRFLRGYAPTSQNDSMIAEKIANFANRYKVEPISFEHPLESSLFPLFFAEDSKRKPLNELENVILTGMAGDGKTSLCYSLWQKLFGLAAPKEKMATKVVDWYGQSLTFTFMFDFTAFFDPQDNQPLPSNVLLFLEEFSDAVFGNGPPEKIFVIAINDGQFAELWSRIPESSPAIRLVSLITEMHVRNLQKSDHRLSFFNLSLVSTRHLFSIIYDAFLSRLEWNDCLVSPDLKEFGSNSPLIRNLRALQSPQYKRRLLELISLCDSCNRHIPVRELLMWIANGLLGLTTAPQGVARLEDLRNCRSAEDAYRGALHRNLLGENLTQSRRERFAIFRFLQGLKLGNETIKDLDELIIFGKYLVNSQNAYATVVEPDPFQQQDPLLDHKLNRYIQGWSEDETEILDALSAERRRIFFSSDPDAVTNALFGRSIWAITVFHNAELYLRDLMDASSDPVPVELHQKVILGLNRIWTGLLAEDKGKLYVAKGLNLSSAPISDIFVMGVEITDDFGNPMISVVKPGPTSLVPQLHIIWRNDHDPFVFDLTLERFEFLMRVAEGVMPNSFSKECWEDIITLKTKLLRHIERANFKPTGVRTIETDHNGNFRLLKIV